jgi:hypothetical protein
MLIFNETGLQCCSLVQNGCLRLATPRAAFSCLRRCKADLIGSDRHNRGARPIVSRSVVCPSSAQSLPVGTPADPGAFGSVVQTMVAAKFQEPAVRKCVSCLAFSMWLAAGSFNANGQTRVPTVVAQAPVTVPPSGVLVTPPPAPSAVPPSGVLVQPEPAERRTVTTVPVKTVQPLRTAERVAPPTMRRHVVHRQTAARRVAPRTLAREDVGQRVTTTRTTTIPAPPSPWPVFNGTNGTEPIQRDPEADQRRNLSAVNRGSNHSANASTSLIAASSFSPVT